MMKPLLIVLLLLAGSAPGSLAAGTGLAQGEAGRVTAVTDGDTLIVDGKLEVRLVGIQAPKLPLGRQGFQAWPLAEEAKAALSELALGKDVHLAYGGQRIDRHGRHLAQLYDQSERWLQGEMLRRGLARVYTFADNVALADDMLALEREARAARRGMWALAYYKVLRVADTPKHLGSFQLVEGEVLQVSTMKGRTYLNFGADWRQDFTIALAAKERRAFDAAGVDLAALVGKRVRVRGWLQAWNGPLIELTHPQQLEMLP